MTASLDSSHAKSAPAGQTHETGDGIIPQARPILMWFNAIKNGDKELLKSAFSTEIRESVTDWDARLSSYESVFHSEENVMGDLNQAVFIYSPGLGDDNGVVSIYLDVRKFSDLLVVREDGVWKLNDR